jgi:hypothetical protein
MPIVLIRENGPPFSVAVATNTPSRTKAFLRSVELPVT